MTINYTQACQGILTNMWKTGKITVAMLKKSPLAAKLSTEQMKDIVAALKNDGRIDQGEFDRIVNRHSVSRKFKSPAVFAAKTIRGLVKRQTLSAADRKGCAKIIYQMATKGRVTAALIKKQFPKLTTQQATALAQAINNDGTVNAKELKNLGLFGPRVVALADFIGDKPVKLFQATQVLTYGARAYFRCKMPGITSSRQLGRCMYTLEGTYAHEMNATRDAADTIMKYHKNAYPFIFGLVSKSSTSGDALESLVVLARDGHLAKLSLTQRRTLAKKLLQKATQASPDVMTFHYFRFVIKKLTGANGRALTGIDLLIRLKFSSGQRAQIRRLAGR